MQPFTVVDGMMQSAENTVVMPTGLVFITVTCINQALLYTTVNTDGILVFEGPPDHVNATLSIFTSIQTVYPIMDNYFPTSSFTLSWTGFEDLNSSYLEYEYRITEADGNSEGWISVGTALQLLISNVSVAIGQRHMVEVRATNPAGLTSQSIAEYFTISMNVAVNDTGTL